MYFDNTMHRLLPRGPDAVDPAAAIVGTLIGRSAWQPSSEDKVALKKAPCAPLPVKKTLEGSIGEFERAGPRREGDVSGL